jgi:imidazoleglycerol-phosphate dehydratase
MTTRIGTDGATARAERRAAIERQTRETNVSVRLVLDGSGSTEIATGIGFYDHLLSSLGHHGLFDLEVRATGDLHVDEHHTVEDVGICLGQALDSALGDRAGIGRYGDAIVPMDEARAICAIDLSGRPYCAFDAQLPPGSIAGFEHELAEEFFRAVASAGRLTVHVGVEAGTNAHHMIEAAFKAFARALRQAVAVDPSERGVPSTKGTLT